MRLIKKMIFTCLLSCMVVVTLAQVPKEGPYYSAIKKNMIKPLLVGTQTPNWKKLEKDIIAKYGKDALGNHIMDAKIEWYSFKMDWEKVGKLTIENFEANPYIFKQYKVLNNVSWEIFYLHVDSKKMLRKVTGWMENVVKASPDDPNFIDTYANLLYKLGRTEEAIVWQEKAVEMNPKIKGHQKSLEDMRNGKQAWLAEKKN